MKEMICSIDSDPKIAETIASATQQLCKTLNLSFFHKSSLDELNQHMAHDDNKDIVISLLILSADKLQEPLADEVSRLKNLYNTNLIITVFDDPLKPLKKIETWPVENIIYKPFDPAILQEHIHFALIKTEKVKTTAVHSSEEKNDIEKIRRQNFLKLSEFGFSIESTFNYNLNEAYKFYHLSFVDKKKSSQWAKAISKTQNIYDFVFCAPTPLVTTALREKSVTSKNKLKTETWQGFEKNKAILSPLIYLHMNDAEDFKKIKDYFSRKFPNAQVFEAPVAPVKEKLNCHLLISEKEFSSEQINFLFKTTPLYFRVTSDGFHHRAEAEKILACETLRLPKPLDRNYLGRMMNSFFPACIESEPSPMNWFQMTDSILHSEMIEASELSEAAFTYKNDRLLKRNEYQEFALTQDDETDLKIIKAKIQFADSTADVENKYLHQVVFFGIRDDILKKLRLWMLQTHIDHKKSN